MFGAWRDAAAASFPAGANPGAPDAFILSASGMWQPHGKAGTVAGVSVSRRYCMQGLGCAGVIAGWHVEQGPVQAPTLGKPLLWLLFSKTAFQNLLALVCVH